MKIWIDSDCGTVWYLKDNKLVCGPYEESGICDLSCVEFQEPYPTPFITQDEIDAIDKALRGTGTIAQVLKIRENLKLTQQ